MLRKVTLNMDDLTKALEKIGMLIAVVVGNIAEFFLGPLPKFLLRLGVPYVILLGLCLITSVIFRLTGFITMLNPISILIAMALIGMMLIISIISRKGGTSNDTDE